MTSKKKAAAKPVEAPAALSPFGGIEVHEVKRDVPAASEGG